MSNIRVATANDVPALMRMARSFIAYSRHGAMIDIADSELEAQTRAILAQPNMSVFVAELDGEVVAMLIGALTSLWFAPSKTMAAELAWWVDERARMSPIAIKLVRMYEGWASANGAQFITMSSLAMNSGPDVGRMLERLGYAKAEMTHIKEQ